MDSRNIEFLTYLKTAFAGEYLLDEPLARHTWYQIGGPADFFVYPKNRDDLIGVLECCRTLDITNIYFLGEGANVLASDAGYRGVIISLRRFFRHLSVQENVVEASAGVLLNDLVLTCERRNLEGVESLAGIPGTVAGALIMNAGTHEGEIGDVVKDVSFLNEQLESVSLTREQIQFSYRSAPELQNHPVLGCTLTLTPEREAVLRERRLAQIRKRKASQPLEYPSCGSVFKRPEGYYVGKMVQDLGLKGFRYGNAMISEKHAGFIVNLGNATASDVLCLIKKIQKAVHREYALHLELEVRLL